VVRGDTQGPVGVPLFFSRPLLMVLFMADVALACCLLLLHGIVAFSYCMAFWPSLTAWHFGLLLLHGIVAFSYCMAFWPSLTAWHGFCATKALILVSPRSIKMECARGRLSIS